MSLRAITSLRLLVSSYGSRFHEGFDGINNYTNSNSEDYCQWMLRVHGEDLSIKIPVIPGHLEPQFAFFFQQLAL